MKIIKYISFSLVLFMLISCGGGGGSGSGGGEVGGGGTSIVSPAKATVGLNVSGAGAEIYGIECKLILPSGVSLATDSSGEVSSNVITLAATGNKTIVSNYLKTTSPSTVAISLILDEGTTPNEFITLQVDVAPGVDLKSTNLVFSEFKVFNGNGAVVSGANGSVTIK